MSPSVHHARPHLTWKRARTHLVRNQAAAPAPHDKGGPLLLERRQGTEKAGGEQGGQLLVGLFLGVVGLGPRGGALDGELPEHGVRDGGEREDDARVAVQLCRVVDVRDVSLGAD